jgi:tyrosyl-tRNA synthetase
MSGKMTLSEELTWRGFINQTTLKDLSLLDTTTITFYHGYDASSDSQAVGNLAAMMLDRCFLRHGHKAIILAGGATSLIGDPGGKDTERQLQAEDTIAHNVAQAQKQFELIFKDLEHHVVNNLDWTKPLNVISYLRDIGKHFSMTELIQRDYIAKRLGEGQAGISYAEFSYTVLQGMDFLHLYDTYHCTLQLGGSDQWGNCLSGVSLIRRTRDAEVHVITLPLVINKATGKKFGKSESGAVWLDASKTTPFQFYQFWLNIDDEGVEGYLKIYTELDKDTVDNLMSNFKTDSSSRAAQKALAYEVTKLVHGEDRVESVKKVTEVLFGDGQFLKLAPGDMSILEGEITTISASNTLTLVEALKSSGLASSNSDANRLIGAGAVTLNDQKVHTDTKPEFIHGKNLIKVGKNKFALVSLE